jgi:hypothetical protein
MYAALLNIILLQQLLHKQLRVLLARAAATNVHKHIAIAKLLLYTFS